MFEVAKFKAFCIECYKEAHGLKGSDAIKTLRDYGVLDYLGECFDALHTQGWQWLVKEMDDFIAERRLD